MSRTYPFPEDYSGFLESIREVFTEPFILAEAKNQAADDGRACYIAKIWREVSTSFGFGDAIPDASRNVSDDAQMRATTQWSSGGLKDGYAYIMMLAVFATHLQQYADARLEKKGSTDPRYIQARQFTQTLMQRVVACLAQYNEATPTLETIASTVTFCESMFAFSRTHLLAHYQSKHVGGFARDFVVFLSASEKFIVGKDFSITVHDKVACQYQRLGATCEVGRMFNPSEVGVVPRAAASAHEDRVAVWLELFHADYAEKIKQLGTAREELEAKLGKSVAKDAQLLFEATQADTAASSDLDKERKELHQKLGRLIKACDRFVHYGELSGLYQSDQACATKLGGKHAMAIAALIGGLLQIQRVLSPADQTSLGKPIERQLTFLHEQFRLCLDRVYATEQRPDMLERECRVIYADAMGMLDVRLFAQSKAHDTAQIASLVVQQQAVQTSTTEVFGRAYNLTAVDDHLMLGMKTLNQAAIGHLIESRRVLNKDIKTEKSRLTAAANQQLPEVMRLLSEARAAVAVEQSHVDTKSASDDPGEKILLPAAQALLKEKSAELTRQQKAHDDLQAQIKHPQPDTLSQLHQQYYQACRQTGFAARAQMRVWVEQAGQNGYDKTVASEVNRALFLVEIMGGVSSIKDSLADAKDKQILDDLLKLMFVELIGSMSGGAQVSAVFDRYYNLICAYMQRVAQQFAPDNAKITARLEGLLATASATYKRSIPSEDSTQAMMERLVGAAAKSGAGLVAVAADGEVVAVKSPVGGTARLVGGGGAENERDMDAQLAAWELSNSGPAS